MADAVVDRLEVVEVEDDEREPPAVPVRPRHLAAERVVEEAPVVQARQRVEVGELPRLAEPPRVVDRRPGPLCELLERPSVAVVERVRGRPAEHGHEPDGPRLRGDRDREPLADQVAVVDLGAHRILVGDLHRPSLPSVGRPRHGLELGFLGRKPDGRHDRLLAGRPRQQDEGRVDAADRARRLQHARQHLVEVDRPAELAEDPAAALVVGRPVGRRAQLLQHAVHPARQLVHHLLEAPLGRPPLAQQHDEEDERERDEDATEDGPAKGVAHGSTPDLVRFALTIPLSGRRFA